MLQPELKMRRDKIRVLMAQQNIEAALITCNVNLLHTLQPYIIYISREYHYNSILDQRKQDFPHPRNY